VYEKERPGQTRGKPLFSSILEKFRMLDKYQRTELQAAIVNAMIAAIVETPLPPEQVAAMFGGDVEGEQFQKWLAQKQEYMAELKGGSMIHTMPGEHVTPFTPARPATAFAPFCDAIARQIGTGVNLPYELVMRDFSKTNYSSARAALLEAWRFFMSRRSWLSTCWASPVYELWLEEAINEGIIEAPRFYEFRYAYSKCKWIGPGRGWIDPLKEAQSSEVRMRNLVSTLEQECAEQGLDWEEVVAQRAAEFARIEELGLDKYLKPVTPKTDTPGEKEPVDTDTDVEEAPEVPMAAWRRMWQRFGSFIGVQNASV
jgi:lambda family phage portal protein